MGVIYKNGTYYGGGSGGGGAEITIDNELSSISENPVQNKVIKAELDKKVDKVTGKGLSTNDYTDEEKNKLAGITAGAKPNVQSDWNQSDNSADDFIKNKPTTVTESLDGEDKGLDLSLVTTGEKYYWSTGVDELFTRTSGLSQRIESTPHPFYAFCHTEASESQKSIDLDLEAYSSDVITSGMIIGVRFTNTNTANNIMLGGMGKAYTSIKYNGAIYTGNDPKITGWENHIIYYMYDGTYFNYMGNDTNEPYTMGDGIKIEDDEISVDEMSAEDMAEVASPMPSVMSRRFKYSTEEQIVGEWIDGKPIYQKTFELSTGVNISANTWINIDTPFSGAERIIFCNGYNHNGVIPLYANPRSDANGFVIYSTIALNDVTKFTVQYTKTTD